MIINLTTGKKIPIIASYSGLWSGIKRGDNDSFEMAFFSSGTLTITSVRKNVDLYLVGAGENGGWAVSTTGGGAGGNGGKRRTVKNIPLSPGTYEICIGAASAQNSSAFSYSTASGFSASGGEYGYCVNLREEERSGGAGGIGEYAFGAQGSVPLLDSVSFNSRKYNLNASRFGAGGGGGGGANNLYVQFANGAGGETGGGAGGNAYGDGSNGTFFGAGGGGGACHPAGNKSAGAGMQGIVLLRSAR